MSRPLRIGIVVHRALGGSSVVAVQLADHLAQAGHDVHVIGTGLPDRRVRDADGPMFHEVVTPNYPVFDAPPLTVAMASRLADCADTNELDVIHVHYAVPYAVSARLAREMITRETRIVVTLHGTDVTGVGADPAYLPATRSALRYADVITAPSHALAHAATAQLVDADRHTIRVVPNFVDTEHYHPGSGSVPHSLVHMSNFRPVKRTGTLVDVLGLVRSSVDAHLTLIGDGPERAATEAAFARAGLADAVTFVGLVSDPAPILRESTICLMPSAEESFGLSALEAMACGVPVVSTDVGGVSEVVDNGVTGHLTPLDRPDAFADATIDLLTDPARRAEMASAARRRAVEQFSPERAVSAYLDLYLDRC